MEVTPMLTKKAKLERFDALQREHDLLQRFFWDVCEGTKVEARASYRTETGDRFTAELYYTSRADGGYIVVKQAPSGVPSVQYWDDWQRMVHGMPFGSEFALAMKSLGEQLRRNIPAHSAALASSVYPKPESEIPRAW